MNCFASLLTLLAAGLPENPQEDRSQTVKNPRTGASFTMKLLPGGRFRMGSPKDEAGRGKDEVEPREVELRPFWIGTHEVTWEEYTPWYAGGPSMNVDGVTRPSEPLDDPPEANPKRDFDGIGQTKRHPALHVGEFGAAGYCHWLSELTGRQFRLPTEAEWEYACRAGRTGATSDALNDEAWHEGSGKKHTHPVGTRKPNAFGLYDMLGNVWEHCLEPYAPPDPRAVIRGGAWNTPRKDVRFANRHPVLGEEWNYSDPFRPIRMWWIPDARFVGFRLVQLPDDGVSAGERKRLAGSVGITSLEVLSINKGERQLTRVRGTLTYTGDRVVDDLEILVHYLDEDGKPLLEDPREKPAFRRCFPVLLNSAFPGEHRKPLPPNGKRTFLVDVPHPVDRIGPMGLDKVAARVTRIHFSPK